MALLYVTVENSVSHEYWRGDVMDLLEHTNAHLKDIAVAKSIEDGDTRSREMVGWQQHVALECSCTAYRDQLKDPELLTLLDEIGVLDILKSWWGDDFAA